MKTKEKGVIDILKIFFAICVVAIHTNAYSFLPTNMSYMVKRGICRLAVPFFFAITGFFLKQKIDKGNDKKTIVKDYCKHLLYPYVVFETISVILNVIIEIHNGKEMLYVILDVARHLLFYPWGALWFVWAQIISSIILYFFIKNNKLNLAISVGLVFYAFMLLYNNYHFITAKLELDWIYQAVNRIIVCPRNALTVGLPFMAIGMKCNEYKEKIIINRKNIIILFLLYILYLLEIMIIYKIGYATEDEGYYLMQISLIPYIVLISNSIETKTNGIYRQLRKLSVGIFYMHSPLNTVFGYIIHNNQIRFIVILIVSIITIKIIEKSNSYKLKRLFS